MFPTVVYLCYSLTDSVPRFTDQTLRKLKLQNPSQRYTAGVGAHSRKFRIQGEPGEDTVIHVPPGVQVSTSDGIVVGKFAGLRCPRLSLLAVHLSPCANLTDIRLLSVILRSRRSK